MANDINPCIYKFNKDFLSHLEEFLDEEDPKEKVRKLSRAEGYLRYLFFELTGQVKDWKDSDLGTLVCGLSYLIVQGVKLCYESPDLFQEMACGISRDLIDLTFYLMRRWKGSEEVYKSGSELWVMLDPEKGLPDSKEAEALAYRLSVAIIGLLGGAE